MGAYDGLYPVRQTIPQASWDEYWTVEYDTGKMVERSFYDLPPVMGRQLEVHYSLEDAQAAAKGRKNAEIIHYKELSDD